MCPRAVTRSGKKEGYRIQESEFRSQNSGVRRGEESGGPRNRPRSLGVESGWRFKRKNTRTRGDGGSSQCSARAGEIENEGRRGRERFYGTRDDGRKGRRLISDGRRDELPREAPQNVSRGTSVGAPMIVYAFRLVRGGETCRRSACRRVGVSACRRSVASQSAIRISKVLDTDEAVALQADTPTRRHAKEALHSEFWLLNSEFCLFSEIVGTPPSLVGTTPCQFRALGRQA